MKKFKIKDLQFTKLSDRTVEVSSCRNRQASKIEIPSSIVVGCGFFGLSKKQYDVTEIGDYAFGECRRLEEVSIPSSIVEIGKMAFKNCNHLKCITIPEGVKEIRYCAFEGCTSLTEISLPKSLENIDESAFRGCDKLVRPENNTDDEDDDTDDIYDSLEYDEERLNKLKELGEKGDAKAQDELGFYYWMNEEPEDAFYWYQKSAQQKYPQGMADLGRCYSGVFYDYEVDHEKAIQLLTEAAELGCADGYFGLCECYVEGYGVEKNMKKAKELYAKAVELGCEYDEPWLEDD
ncbi:MAG: leucine-rich repeat protein [Bacteroidales bacterium]|nr:leucine-rich repeat protein [Bacteroidales bacterium]